MAEFKPNYIITEMKKNVILAWGRPGQPLADYVPGRNRHMEHVLYIDGEVGPGTFYSECLWFMSNDKVHPEIRKRMLVLTRYDGKFEHAKEEREYHINPKLILTEDILDPQGNTLFLEGTVFDPTKYVKLGRYVIIDGNSPKQVEFALKGDFKKIILISGNLEKLTRTYEKPFYFANDELIGRFKIRRVPAVIEGEGEYVKVTEKAL